MARGGERAFFRRQIGLITVEEKEQDGPKLRDKIVKQRSKAKQFEYLTPMFLEMKIALEYLHITHGEYKKLSKDEQLKCYLYELMRMEREEYFNGKMESSMRKSKDVTT